MMGFDGELLRQAMEGEGGAEQRWLATLVRAAETGDELFLSRTAGELAELLKSQSESPVLKFKAVKTVMYLVLLGDSAAHAFQEQLFPIIRSACLFNRSQPVGLRGVDFFRNNKFTAIATFQERAKIRDIGCRYIVFCLECASALALAHPPPHPFATAHAQLQSEGVTFPPPHEHVFFTQARVQQLQEALQRAGESRESSWSGQGESEASISELREKLREKDRIISELRSTLPPLNEAKVQEYEHRIAALTQQVVEVKAKLKLEAQTAAQAALVPKLQARIEELSRENEELREQLAEYSRPSSGSLGLTSQGSKKHLHWLQLAEVCVEPQETKPTQPEPQHFFLSANEAVGFTPFYAGLSGERQVRLRRSLLKRKEVLCKQEALEIGCICASKGDIELVLSLVITNRTNKPLLILALTIDSPPTMPIHTLCSPKLRLLPTQQTRRELHITINDIDCRCAVAVIEYQCEGSKVETLCLLLPVSLFKLASWLPFTAVEKGEWSSVERVMELDRRVLGSLDKLKDYFPCCYVRNQPHKEYCLKAQLLQTTVFVTVGQVGETMRVRVESRLQDRLLAEKLLREWQFMLSK